MVKIARRLLVLGALLVAGALPAAARADVTLVGDPNISTAGDSNPAGVAEAFRSTAVAGGTLNKVNVYLASTNTATKLVAGLYAETGSHPGTLLAQGTLNGPTAGAWNAVPVAATNLTAGTAYWIALLGPSSSGTLAFRDKCCGGSGSTAEASSSSSLSALPASWSTGSVYHDGPASAYGSGDSAQLPPADQVGRWSAPITWPGVAVHMAMAPTGKVLFWDGFDAGPNSHTLWDPTTGSFQPVPYGRNLFCGGHSWLADGRLFIAGGHVNVNVGLKDTTIFDPFTLTWTRKVDMANGRWYPTSTTLPDGRVFVIAGDNISQNNAPPITPLSITSHSLPEIYDPVSNTYQDFTSSVVDTPWYPFFFVLPDGRLFDAGPDPQSHIFDTATGAWSNSATSPIDGSSAVMYRPGMVMKSGTWSDPDFKDRTVTGRTNVIDMNQSSPSWQETSPMAFARSFENLTVLADGSVLATGGTTKSDGIDLANAVLPAERWDPSTKAWTMMSALQNGRGYHTTSLLLPDARVLVAGSGQLPGSGAIDQKNAEIFSPPYLFKGARPTISAAPATVSYASSFTITTPDAASIGSAALVRIGAVTHDIDMDQRYVPLTFTAGSGQLTATAPANANVAPPGYYMLFVTNTQGVPSVSKMVRLPLPASDGVPPAAPGNLRAAGGLSSVQLDWSAASDNVGVTAYDVYRSTSSGFTPGTGNLVTKVTATSFTDTGRAAGTYYYVVKAEDAAGNLSPASGEASATVTGDQSAPSAQLTAPSDGATVSGAVTVSATATDNVGVAGVQFKLDGANLGAEDTSAPYSVSWASTAASNGNHTLTAVARDAAGNTGTSAAVQVNVQNTAGTALIGTASILAGHDNNIAGSAEAFLYTAGATGAATKVRVYIDTGSAATSIVAGIYTDAAGKPGTLLGQGTLSSPASAAWNVVPITSASLTAGTKYWIALLGRGGQVNFRDSCCGGGTAGETSSQSNLTALTTTWSRGTVYKDGPASLQGTS